MPTLARAQPCTGRALPPVLRRPACRLAAVLLTAAIAMPAAAQNVRVSQAWVRAMVAGQSTTGAFMKLEASEDAKVIAVATPVAKLAEVHETVSVGNVMKMRPVSALDLPAGKQVELRPGAHHIMLSGITKRLKQGDIVALTLTIEGPGKKLAKLEVNAQVRALNAPAAKDGHSAASP